MPEHTTTTKSMKSALCLGTPMPRLKLPAGPWY